MIENTLPNLNSYVLSAEEQKTVGEKAKKSYERLTYLGPPLGQKKAIINFEELIRTIDHYGEQVEKIDPMVLNSYWMQCEQILANLGIRRELQVILMKDLRDYADMEAGIRKGKKLADYEIGFFYFKKSCDVRMHRHLTKYLNGHAPLSSDDEITRDIIEEIKDDIDDIEEDKLTPFNGNIFLELLNSKDIPRLQEYITFLNSLSNAPQLLIKEIVKKISSEIDKINQ